jgi:hypothetical protein
MNPEGTTVLTGRGYPDTSKQSILSARTSIKMKLPEGYTTRFKDGVIHVVKKPSRIDVKVRTDFDEDLSRHPDVDPFGKGERKHFAKYRPKPIGDKTVWDMTDQEYFENCINSHDDVFTTDADLRKFCKSRLAKFQQEREKHKEIT